MKIIWINGLSWNVTLDSESQNWIGVCDALGLVLESETWNDLVEIISEGLDAMRDGLRSSGPNP